MLGEIPIGCPPRVGLGVDSSMIFSAMEAIRFETTVGKGGFVLLPEVHEGEQVEVIVLKLAPKPQPVRLGGWAEGKVRMLPGFDDPIPGMEDYV